MSEIQQLQNLVQQLSSPDNAARDQAEQQINQSATQNPDAFSQIALSLLADSSVNTAQKMSTVIMLKKLFVLGKSKPALYLKLTTQGKQTLTNQSLILLNQTEAKQLADQIADFIADLASSLYNDSTSNLPQEEKWGDLVNHLFDLYRTNNELSMVCALRILEGILDQTDDKLSVFAPQLLELFENGFAHAKLEIQFATMKTLIAMVMSFKAKDCKQFKPLIDQVLQLTVKLLESNNETYLQEAITKLFDLCSASPFFIKRKYADFILVMGKVRDLEDQTDSNMKIESVESLVNVIERYPELADDKTILTQVVELIFKNMLEIEDEVTSEWMSPPDGFNDDLIEDDDQKIVKIQMDLVDRLLNILGAEQMVPFLSDYIQKMLTQNNWKMSHAAVMTISQLGEYLDEDLKQVASLLTILQQKATDQNPRLRYAVCQALGQFADDLAPDFQLQFHQQYFSTVLPLLNDSVPRVVAHCLASLTNFLEHSSPEQISPHFTQLYSSINNHLYNNISFVQEACLSALSALAEGSSTLFLPHYNDVMKLIFDILKNASKREQKTLRGSAIECATIIAKTFSKENFQPYQDPLVNEMIRIQSSELDSEGSDPQKQYLLSGWQRLCIVLDQELVPYIDKLMPSLLAMVRRSIEGIDQDAKGFRSSAHEEADIAIQLINIFLEQYGAQLSKYINEIYTLINLINDNVINPETKITALSCLPQLLKISKNQNLEYKSLGTQTFGLLWDLFITEKDSSFKSEFCYLMQEVLKKTGDIFSEQELQQFLLKVEDELRLSAERKKNVLEDIDVEEEDKKNIEFNIKCEHGIEDDFRLEVANLFGKVFESHRAKALPIFKHLYQTHIIPCLQGEGALIDLEYGIYLVCDGIEFLGEFIDLETLQQLSQILLKHLFSNFTEIRQSSAFGLGIIAPHLKQSLDSAYLQIMQDLVKMVQMPRQEKVSVSTFKSAKENGVAALGKILKIQWTKMDQSNQYQYVKFFVNNLPIVYDHKEAVEMHALLLQLCQNNWNLVLGNNNENLQQIIVVFTRIYESEKISNDQINASIKQITEYMIRDQSLQQQIIKLTLTEEQQMFLKKFAN